MSMIEDMFKGGNIMTGLAFGMGAAVLAPLAMPILRPVSKGILKAGLVVYDQGRAAFADLNERSNDMIAEARAEMATEHHNGPMGAASRAGHGHEMDEAATGGAKGRHKDTGSDASSGT